MNLLIQCFAVAGAGALGAITRFAINSTLANFSKSFPLATFVINITGSFALGYFLTYAGQRTHISETTRLAVAVGFLGAYTTFSTFMAETDSLFQNNAPIKALVYMFFSLAIGLLALRAGIWLASR
jgi:CrcB protein